MKTTIFTTLILIITLNIFGQEKKRVFAPSFDTQYANLVIINKGVRDTLKVIQETIVEEDIKMSGKQYNLFFDSKIDNGTYKLKKVFKSRPVNMDRFFNEVYILEYFYNKEGKTIIIMQKVNNSLTLK